MSSKTYQLPASDCQFFAELELKEREKGDNRSTPFRAVARSSEPVFVPMMGDVVHDFSGMRHKSRVPIDNNHTPTLVGYANKFPVEDGNLVVAGAITPNKYDNTAETIIENAENGIPYEMSITFDDARFERIPEGESVEVNERTFEGPITVIREWNLRGVAVTPYGRDANTALNFSSDDTVTATEITKEPNMADDVKQENTPETEDETKVEVVDEVQDDSSEEDKDALAEAIAEQPESVETETAEPAAAALSLAAQYQAEFGRVQGALYFAEGLSLEDARRQENARLREEITQLKAKLDDRDGGLDEPTKFSAGGDIEPNVLHEVPGERAETIIKK